MARIKVFNLRFPNVLSLLVFLLTLQVGNSPLDLQVTLSDYQAAKASLYVLKNEKATIPLKGDHVHNLRSFYYGNQLAGIHRYFERYFPIEHQAFSPESASNHSLDPSGLKILYLDLSILDNTETIIGHITPVLKQEDWITVIFGSREDFKKAFIDFSGSQQLIFVEGISGLHQSLATQLLFGAIGTDQKLPEDINSFFKKGNGFTIEGGIRLNYGPPELAGMNRDSLSRISSIAQSAIDSAAFPGCQVLVVKDQQVVYHEAWGYHTYGQKREVNLTDIYDFASVTKVTSALAALMKLHGEGKFKLDAPFKEYWPAFKKTNKANLPIRKVLAHHAQLKPWIPYWRSTIKKNGKFKWKTFKKKYSKRFPIAVTDDLYLHRKYKERIYKAIKKSPLNEQPGYVYSGLSFYLWPEIVANLTGQEYESYLKNTFYKPLGAQTITYNPYKHFPLERIIPTERDTFFRMVQIHGKVHDEGAAMMDGVSANAGLFGSANDLAKLMQMYLNKGSYGGEQFIAESTLEEFTRCQFCEEENRRGLGFDKPLIEYDVAKSSVAKDASPDSFGHSGYTGTFTWVDPEHELIFIFFSNRVHPTRENRKIYQLNVRPQIHQVIYNSFLK